MITRLLLTMLLLVASLHVQTSEARTNADLIINNDTSWKYATSNQDIADDWQQAAFNDSQWRVGKAGFGYGDNDDVTELNDMFGNYDKVYIRTSFSHQESDDKLYLYMYFDDAFIAYINGEEVARGGLNDEQQVITTSDPIDKRFTIKLPDAKDGQYTLAIVGFNHHNKSSDFSLLPWLGTHYFNSSQRAWMRQPKQLTKQQALTDIEAAKHNLKERASYLHRYDQDIIAQIDSFAAQLPQAITTHTFATQLNQIIASMGDCHYTMVPSPLINPHNKHLPFKLARTNIGWIALDKDTNKLLAKDFPIVTAINNIPLAQYQQAAKKHLRACSAQMVAKNTLSLMQYNFPILQQELGKTDDITNVTLTLGNSTQNKTVELKLDASDRSVKRSKLKRIQSQKLAKNIGYLRIKSMNKKVKTIHKAMKAFKHTDGLIIDIRGNGGGTYHILDAIYGYLIPHDTPGQIINVAAVRDSSDFKDSHLDYRKTYSESDKRWSDDERAAIATFKQQFSPKWQPTSGEFRPWQYRFAKRESYKQFYYDKPVIVLTNAGSASASDGFASALSLLPQVKLIGEPSAGMSGANRGVTLPNSQLTLRLSSMASFRPNGQLFEGNGVEVDLLKLPTVKDHTDGQDSVLIYSHQLIRHWLSNES